MDGSEWLCKTFTGILLHMAGRASLSLVSDTGCAKGTDLQVLGDIHAGRLQLLHGVDGGGLHRRRAATLVHLHPVRAARLPSQVLHRGVRHYRRCHINWATALVDLQSVTA